MDYGNVVGLGLLRTLLALAVVIAHTSSIWGYRILDAVMAVQGFYIISGFYMALILNEKYLDRISLFYKNRFLRLYPLYFVTLILTIGLAMGNYLYNGQWNGLYYIADTYRHEEVNIFSWVFIFLTNLTMIGQDWTPFLALDPVSGNIHFTPHYYKESHALYKFMLLPQTWSVGLEIMFYMVAPWIVRKNIRLLVIIFSLSIGLRIYLRELGFIEDPWNYRFFPTELALFTMGIIAYKWYSKIKDINEWRYFNLPITIIAIIVTLFFHLIPGEYILKQWIYYIMIMCMLPFLFMFSKNSVLDRKIGDLSYSIYIVHGLVILTIIAITPNQIDYYIRKGIFGVITSLISIIVAIILLKYVQQPIDKYRELQLLKKRRNNLRNEQIKSKVTL